jgi:Ribosomal protein S10p/S20e
MFFYLKVSSKGKRILKKFITVFTKLESLPVFFKLFSIYEKRKFITVLKSPHVNKTAQEQFEYRFYSKHFLIYSFKPLTLFLLLKKLKNVSFPGVNLKIKGLFERTKTNKHLLNIINPDNIVLIHFSKTYVSKQRFKISKRARITKIISQNSKANSLLSKKYIQLFDLYGEAYLRNVFYS